MVVLSRCIAVAFVFFGSIVVVVVVVDIIGVVFVVVEVLLLCL